MEDGDLWTLSHPLFTLPLVEMLKRRGLYGLHAGGVCLHGRALLLPGTSGSGKTTLTLALARGEALLELAPNVLLTEPRSAQAHLDALAELVEKSDCWRLATGTDLDETVRRLVELL